MRKEANAKNGVCILSDDTKKYIEALGEFKKWYLSFEDNTSNESAFRLVPAMDTLLEMYQLATESLDKDMESAGLIDKENQSIVLS